MKVFIIGVGLVGKEVARQLSAQGHTVIGSTTTPEKVAALQGVCTEVVVLTGDNREKIRAIGQGCEAVIITVSPNVRQARTKAERETQYKRVFVHTCQNAIDANARCIFASSFSVYGDGGPGDSPILEDNPLSTADEPSTVYYQAAENLVLGTGQGTTLRFPDIYGAEGDLTFTQRVELGHQLMGGRVPFGPDALLYRIHCLDAASAIVHALNHNLVGAYNVCDNSESPPRNQTVFDQLADKAGLGRLIFLDQIKLPNRPISSEKLMATGFQFRHTNYHFE